MVTWPLWFCWGPLLDQGKVKCLPLFVRVLCSIMRDMVLQQWFHEVSSSFLFSCFYYSFICQTDVCWNILWLWTPWSLPAGLFFCFLHGWNAFMQPVTCLSALDLQHMHTKLSFICTIWTQSTLQHSFSSSERLTWIILLHVCLHRKLN